MITKIKHATKVQQLKANPNKWRKVGAYGTLGSARAAASNIRNKKGALGGPGKPYSKGKYDVKVRPASLEVWARYVK